MEAYLGQLILFAGDYPPAGWAFCNGALLAVNEYQALYALLGTTYGGDGVNTFGLPDLRSRLPVGMGTGPGLTARTLGQTGGTETVTLTSASMPAHTHPLNASTAQASSPAASGAVLASVPANSVFYANPPTPIPSTYGPYALGGDTIGTCGSGIPHDNVMPVQAISYLICVTGGIFPS